MRCGHRSCSVPGVRFHRLFLALLLVLGCTGHAFGTPGRVQVTLLVTTDLHGNLYPIDYSTDREAPWGLARVATAVRQARKAKPNLLLIDCGDTIQGTPLAYYHNRRNNTPVHPMMLAMNALRYDAMTVGNHEYNFGLPVLQKAKSEAAFPWLSANTYRAGGDETAFTPYVVREVDGVRVGILGITTPGVPYWDNPENWAGLEFRDPVKAAAHWVEVLRNREKVDLVIGAFHMGVEEDLASGRNTNGEIAQENACVAIARAVPGIDVMVMGHTHRPIPALLIGQTLLAQAGKWGDHLLQVDVFLEPRSNGGWAPVARASRLTAMAGVEPDAEILTLVRPYHEETQAWLARPIGRSEAALDASDGYFRDNALLDLVQRVQLESAGADVSMAANFNPRARVPAGAVTVRDTAGLYIYENTLYLVEVTGEQLKAALEHSARFFRPYEAGKTAAELVDPRIPGYNFDLAEGVSYTIDLRQPHGHRILNLEFQGRPLAPDRKLKLALNNYRYNGGGGYSMFRNAPILWRSSGEIRDLIIDWVERNGTIPTKATGNWRLVGAGEDRNDG